MCNTWETFKLLVPRVTHGIRIAKSLVPRVTHGKHLSQTYTASELHYTSYIGACLSQG